MFPHWIDSTIKQNTKFSHKTHNFARLLWNFNFKGKYNYYHLVVSVLVEFPGVAERGDLGKSEDEQMDLLEVQY